MVQRDPAMSDVWWVAAHKDDRPFIMAAIDPVCPRCGLTMGGIDELEGVLVQSFGAEVGPVFDFVRSLA
jgi:hypothetical protein